MTFEQFCEAVCTAVQQFFGDSITVNMQEVKKNNGKILHGIIIFEKQKKKNVIPTIYLNDFFQEYNKGETLANIVKKVLEIYSISKTDDHLEVNFFLQYELVKKKIAYKLVNLEKNKELLKEIPFVPFLDMAITFYCMVISDKSKSGTITIHNDHIKMWNITKEQLLNDAKINTCQLLPAEIKNMNQIMDEMLSRDEMIQDNSPMYVLTNIHRHGGAVCMLYEGVLEQFSDIHKCDLYLLPSSIHEIIIIPITKETKHVNFKDMVEDVNQTQVEHEEMLSNHVYCYHRKNKEITILE